MSPPRSSGHIFGLVGLVGLALIVIFTSYFAYSERQNLQQSSQRDLSGAAFFLADHASRLFEVAEIALAGAANSIEDRSWDEIADSRDIQRQLRITADNLPQIEDIWLNDPSGELRATSYGFPAPASNARDRTAFKEVLAGDKGLIVGDLIVGRVTQRRTFLLARRLTDKLGQFNGMASVTADLAYFSDYWSRVRLPNQTTVSLVRAPTGQVLVQFPAPENASVEPSPPEAFTRFLSQQSGRLPVSGGSENTAIRRVGDLPLYVVISASPDAVPMAWRGWLLSVIPFAAVAFLGLAGLTFAGYVQTTREASSHRELRKAQQELIAANANLESTVAERTAELTESNEEIQRFAYIVSHDLRAPLVNIMGFTSELERFRSELLAMLPDGKAESLPQDQSELIQDFDEALSFIKSSIEKMDRLINAILSLSRQGGRRFNPERIEMKALLQGIADAMAHQAMEASAELEIGDVPDLYSDRLAIEQVFSNLIDNALKYLKPNVPGRIEVTAKRSGTFTVYEVRDNGRGISNEDHKRIFELFRRSGVQDRQGEGIGLAHVKALVRRLGGIITVESAIGEGSTFRVALPSRPPGDYGANG